MIKESSREILAYGNILINSQERLETFKETISNWQEKIAIDMKIRVRGNFATEATNYCKKYTNVKCKKGSDFIQWRIQAHLDILELNSKYVMIFLEDHQIVSSQSHFNEIVTSLIKDEVDVFQYSWFEHYRETRQFLENCSSDMSSRILSLTINLENRNEFVRHSGRYIVSLTSIFRKEVLLELLKTHRPWFKKYDSRGPFDVEKSPKLSFYLPLKFALPISEFALCVDDEMGITGTSAVSRGLSNLPLTKRGMNHYSKFSPRFWWSIFRTNSTFSTNNHRISHSSFIKLQLSRTIDFANVASNTLEFLLFEVIDKTRLLIFHKNNT
jgi:hypothetical protein